MGKTKRNASRWMEARFKLGDPMYPDDHFADKRYQNKVRNGNHTYHCEKLDPLTMKPLGWAEYDSWFKVKAKRTARHHAKITVLAMAHIQVQEDWEEYWTSQWDDSDWYDDQPMSFDFSWSDEAYEYAAQRRMEEEENLRWEESQFLDMGYDPYDYDFGFEY